MSRADFGQPQLAYHLNLWSAPNLPIRGRLRLMSRVSLWLALTGIVEHHDDVVQRNMDICRSGYGTSTVLTRYKYRSQSPRRHREWQLRSFPEYSRDMLQKPVWTASGEIPGDTIMAYTAVTPALWQWKVCNQLMLGHEVQNGITWQHSIVVLG